MAKKPKHHLGEHVDGTKVDKIELDHTGTLELNPTNLGEDQLRAAMQDILNTMFSPDTWDDSVYQTADRMIRYLQEYIPQPEIPFTFTTFAGDKDQLIIVKDIPFTSICAHHMLPFFGVAHVAYLPNKKIVGLSKIPRLVEWMATQPTTQEKLGQSTADYLKTNLDAKGTAVVINSAHTCLTCRGARSAGASMVTSVVTGIFLTVPSLKAEFHQLVQMTKGY